MIEYSKEEISIVYVYNVHVRGKKASVWIAPGYYDDDDDECPLYDELDNSIKVIGPTDLDTAQNVYDSLIQVFSNCGFKVSSGETADD